LPAGYENFLAIRASATGQAYGSLVKHNQSSVDTLFMIPFPTGESYIFPPHRAAVYTNEHGFLKLAEPAEAIKQIPWASQAVGAIGETIVGNLYIQSFPDGPIGVSVVLWQGNSLIDVRKVTVGPPSTLTRMKVFDVSVAGDLLIGYEESDGIDGFAILKRAHEIG
jgi:hypothetical protein